MLTPALITELQDCFNGRARLQEAAMAIKIYTKDASLFYSCVDGWGKKKYINIPIDPTDLLPLLNKYIGRIDKEIMKISGRVEVIIQNFADVKPFIEDYKIRYPSTFTSEEKIYQTLEEAVIERRKGNPHLVSEDYHIEVCSDWDNKIYVFSVISETFNQVTFQFKEICKV